MADLCCGRGRGKSFFLVFVATMALSLGPDEIGLFLQPDWKRVRRVFLKKWRQIVPKSLYTLNKTEQCITWLPTGSMLFYGPRNITGALDAADDSQLGQDTTFIIDDEAALRCSYTMYTNNLATIREPSNVRFYLTASTPRVGAYKRLVTTEGHKLFRGKSDDNPYLPDGYVENLRANMSAEQARRELDGEFISLEGKIWKTAKCDTAWPNGNRHDEFTGYDKTRPWWLLCDLGGATGAYVAIQQTDANFRGRMLFHDPVWVAVADFCPSSDASASRAFRLMRDHFGIPAGIVGGADINTAASTDGKTIAYFAQEIFGNVPIYPCSERQVDKQIQYDLMSFLVCAANNERRFTVARDFVALDQDSRRGVREMFEEDAWPDESRRRPSDFLPKNREITVQHVRDALLMGAAKIMNPPDWLQSQNPAA
ncbi:MAG: hypothetical protein GY835_24905 [bacterium]|nr:hypothetical protein [bacterium]